MKRILAFTLIFAMLFTAMLGIMPAAAANLIASYQTATLYISRANLQFDTTVYLLVEVNYGYAGLTDGSNVKLDVTNKAGETVTLTPDASIEGIADDCVGFKYTDLSAKEMGDTLTIKAHCDGVASDEVTYSVLEYAIKAMTTQPGSKLATVCEKMLAFGAAAQDAFDYKGDHALADENGVIDYGMVLVGGAATRKVIAPVGSLVNPTADTNTFTSEAALYDMSFNTVDAAALTVADGISRYFYYGADVTGNPDKYNNQLANTQTYASKHLLNSIDFGSMYVSANMTDPVTITTRTGMTQNSVDNGMIAGKLDNSNAFNFYKGGSYRTWGLVPYKNTVNALTSATLKQRTGCLYVNTPANTESDTNWLSIYNNMTANTAALVDGENKLTVSVALAVTAANYANTKINAGFTVMWTSNGQGTIYNRSGTPKANLFHVENGVMYVGDMENKSGSIANLRQIGESWTNGTKLVIVHFVLDLNRETVTAYNASTGEVVMRSITIANGFFNDIGSGTSFNIQISGEAYVSRITVSEGDLFN